MSLATGLMLPFMNPNALLGLMDISQAKNPKAVQKKVLGMASNCYGIDVKGDGKLYVDPTGQDKFAKAILAVAQENRQQKGAIDDLIGKVVQNIQQLKEKVSPKAPKLDLKIAVNVLDTVNNTVKKMGKQLGQQIKEKGYQPILDISIKPFAKGLQKYLGVYPEHLNKVPFKGSPDDVQKVIKAAERLATNILPIALVRLAQVDTPAKGSFTEALQKDFDGLKDLPNLLK